MKGSPSYKAYLASPQWQAKRYHYFSVFPKMCNVCKKSSGPIHLHHLTYENFGRENLADLVALCPKCHRDVEKLHYKMGRRIDRRVVFQALKAANLKRR